MPRVLDDVPLLEVSELGLLSAMLDVPGACLLAEMAVAVRAENIAKLL